MFSIFKRLSCLISLDRMHLITLVESVVISYWLDSFLKFDFYAL